MTPKQEIFYHNLAIKNIPNGGTYYDILTEYIRKKYGWPILNEDFMNDIYDKIREITDDILSDKFRIIANKAKVVMPGLYFWINGEEKVLHIEIQICDYPTDENYIHDCYNRKYGWLVIPIGLDKSLSEIRLQGIFDDNVEELTKETNKCIANDVLRNQTIKKLYEQIRTKKNRRFTSRKNYNI